MTVAMLVALSALGQEPDRARVDPGQYPLALHRTMEIDDLDHEIGRLRDSVMQKRLKLPATQRLAERGMISRGELAAEASSLHLDEAREAEATAYRALKVYERDVLGHTIPPDEAKAYALLLDWVKKQEAIAQVDADYRDFLLRQSRNLYQRKAISRQELDDDELNYAIANASVALSRTRQARVELEMAEHRAEPKADRGMLDRLRIDYLRRRVRYYELSAELARRRLDMARDRARRGLLPQNEVAIFEKGVREADADLEEARKHLAPAAPAVGPAPAPRAGVGPSS